ncbi:MAG: SGNH/GDSL hydrolase family protein [Tatlockia sp.]|nr:SGNH/GDSL hydrolase family protein [Tatlockia sp.]
MKLIVGLFILLLSTWLEAKPLNNIVIFGDSLSDNGNLYELYKIPSSPPYFAGRFSNGPVWIEALVASYFHEKANAHLQNYAFGGAAVAKDDNDGTYSLKLELDTYLGAHHDKAADNNLYVIWIGANNYLMTPSNVNDTLDLVNTGIKKSLRTLVKAGAKHIMLVNLPDLGTTPFPSQFYPKEEVPLIREQLSSYTLKHNELLAETINEFKQTNPEVKWLYFDVNSRFNEFLQKPERFGIRNFTEACYLSDTDKPLKNSMLQIASRIQERVEPGDCEDYLFFDGVHPSARTHKILAEQAKAYLEAEGVEFVN